MLAFASPTPDATPVWLVSAGNWSQVRSTIGAAAAAFADVCGFEPKAGRMQFLPGEAGTLHGVLFGVDELKAPARDPFAPAKLAASLPGGVYRFANPPEDADLAALGFLLGLYRYDRFKADKSRKPRLVAPDEAGAIRIQRIAAAVAYGRDLVNAPANALGPTRSSRRPSSLPSILTRASPWCAATSSSPLFLLSTRSGGRPRKSRASSTFSGDARTRRKWRSSARASPSTPAASTSSRPRAWSG